MEQVEDNLDLGGSSSQQSQTLRRTAMGPFKALGASPVQEPNLDKVSRSSTRHIRNQLLGSQKLHQPLATHGNGINRLDTSPQAPEAACGKSTE